jgi:hypothetical protein
MAEFPGFARPKSNFFRLPNDWFDIWRQSREALAQGSQPARIVGPLKIVEYVIKYTWGRTNFDDPVRLSRSDLRKGVRGRHNRRLDKGTGLGSEATISRGISTALALGLLEQVEINDDPGRQERLFLPRLRPPDEDEEISITRPADGFERPTANFFLVPNYWSDISADIRSEILIIAIEYFFRHSWGWQTGEQEIRWLDADDVASGRKYRSEARRGERYDGGTGYTTRKLRDALEDGVKRGLLVWRQGQVSKVYALRMAWMEGITVDGQYDLETDEQEDFLAIRDQTVGGKDQNVGVEDQFVGGWDQDVVVQDQGVDGKDQTVAVRDQTVEAVDQTVEGRDQTVDRTYKDTVLDTQIDTKKTTTARHRQRTVVVAEKSQNENMAIFFRPELSNGDLGLPKQLSIPQATDLILSQSGAWYWSAADLANPERADQAGFTRQELMAQSELDNYLLGRNRAFLDDGQQRQVLSLLEIARRSTASPGSYPPPLIFYSLWQLLDLPEPNGIWGDLADQRRRVLHGLQQQAAAWGDPDLITALERNNISADEARSLVASYGTGLVGGWLRSLRANSGNVRSLAAVLISRLSKGLSPPGGPMEPVAGVEGEAII